ncbi:MAG: hypothetical protein ACTTIC_05600 [Helicobacteraceae bacterium]
MDILESLYGKKYESAPKRRIETSDRAIIQAPACLGGVSLAKSRVGKNDRTLFVDLSDLRCIDLNKDALQHFLRANPVDFLCVNNFDEAYKDLDCTGTERVFFITKKSFKKDGFQNIELRSLDFEEFLSLNYSNDIQKSFDAFLKQGGILELNNLNEDLRTQRINEILRLDLVSVAALHIFIFFVQKTGFVFSLFQAFGMLKEKIKLSKDFFYREVYELEQNRYIYAVEKLGESGCAKKYYPFDFSLRQGIVAGKNLSKTFENMVFLELLKRYKKVFYTDYTDFFAGGLGVVCLPFCDFEKIAVKTKLARKNSAIQRLLILTMGYEYEGVVDKLPVRAAAFWSWSLE